MTSHWMGKAWSCPDWIERTALGIGMPHPRRYCPHWAGASVVTHDCTPVKRTMSVVLSASWQAENMAHSLDSFRQQTHFSHNLNECPL